MRDTAASKQLLPPQEQLTTVAAPSLSEKMGGDAVPWNDSPDIDVPKAPSPPVQHKPAAPSKPPISKKGGQKIAGARR
jgi:hypothetical protein